MIVVASLDDLASMKVSAIAGRGAARDFWDLHTLIMTGRSLTTVLDAFRRKYPSQDLGHVLRALVYFGDAEAAPLPEGLTPERWEAVKRDFEAWVPPLIS